jgi:hypothetical protein
VTWAREIAIAVEAARVMMVLAVKTSAWVATMERDSVMILVKDVVDRAALAEWEA